MADDEFLASRSVPTLSRRDLVKYGALGVGTALLGLPLWSFAKQFTPTDQSALDFVTRYFAARDQAVLENAPGRVIPLIDSNNSAMLSFEVDRVARLHHAAHDEGMAATSESIPKYPLFRSQQLTEQVLN